MLGCQGTGTPPCLSRLVTLLHWTPHCYQHKAVKPQQLPLAALKASRTMGVGPHARRLAKALSCRSVGLTKQATLYRSCISRDHVPGLGPCRGLPAGFVLHERAGSHHFETGRTRGLCLRPARLHRAASRLRRVPSSSSSMLRVVSSCSRATRILPCSPVWTQVELEPRPRPNMTWSHSLEPADTAPRLLQPLLFHLKFRGQSHHLW